MSNYKSTRLSQNNQQKRGRELSPSRNAIYSPLSIQQDQKEIIITKLKEQIYLLQKNETQLAMLKDHYKKLDHQFNLLLSQKESNDKSFAKHHEAALKQICLMKNQFDSMKIQFRQQKLQIQDLAADQTTLKNQLDQKQIEIEKLKNQLRSSIADNEQLGLEHQKIIQIHRNVSDQRQRRVEDCQKMKIDIQKVEQKFQDLRNYQLSLQKQEKALTEQIIRLQQENNRNDQEISATCQDLSILDRKIDQSQQNIGDLQKKIAQTATYSDKYKNQALLNKKSIQAEIMKNNDTTKNIQQAENLFGVRVNQVKQGHRQIEVLTGQNVSLEKVNVQLEDDLQACRKHLQNLSLLNCQLVQHMQGISQQDEQVRALIDRRQRVQRAEEIVKQVDASRKDLNLGTTRQTSRSSFMVSKTGRKYY